MTNSLPWYRWPIEIDGLPLPGYKMGGSFHIFHGFPWHIDSSFSNFRGPFRCFHPWPGIPPAPRARGPIFHGPSRSWRPRPGTYRRSVPFLSREWWQTLDKHGTNHGIYGIYGISGGPTFETENAWLTKIRAEAAGSHAWSHPCQIDSSRSRCWQEDIAAPATSKIFREQDGTRSLILKAASAEVPSLHHWFQLSPTMSIMETQIISIQSSTSSKYYPINQWEFQDPKMEVLYHIRPYTAINCWSSGRSFASCSAKL